jgi:hypothetical protein
MYTPDRLQETHRYLDAYISGEIPTNVYHNLKIIVGRMCDLIPEEGLRLSDSSDTYDRGSIENELINMFNEFSEGRSKIYSSYILFSCLLMRSLTQQNLTEEQNRGFNVFKLFVDKVIASGVSKLFENIMDGIYNSLHGSQLVFCEARDCIIKLAYIEDYQVICPNLASEFSKLRSEIEKKLQETEAALEGINAQVGGNTELLMDDDEKFSKYSRLLALKLYLLEFKGDYTTKVDGLDNFYRQLSCKLEQIEEIKDFLSFDIFKNRYVLYIKARAIVQKRITAMQPQQQQEKDTRQTTKQKIIQFPIEVQKRMASEDFAYVCDRAILSQMEEISKLDIAQFKHDEEVVAALQHARRIFLIQFDCDSKNYASAIFSPTLLPLLLLAVPSCILYATITYLSVAVTIVVGLPIAGICFWGALRAIRAGIFEIDKICFMNAFDKISKEFECEDILEYKIEAQEESTDDLPTGSLYDPILDSDTSLIDLSEPDSDTSLNDLSEPGGVATSSVDRS